MKSDAGPKVSALITGAGVRIGRAIALHLAAAGWPVAVHYHNSAAAAEDVVNTIIGAGGEAVAVAADLADHQATLQLVPAVAERLAPVACLINNASIFEWDTIETATAESWDSHIAINLRAPLFLSQAFAKQLPVGVEGNIINLLDQRVWKLTPFFTSYTVSKTGLLTLTETLAMALAPQIRVNAIGPGPTLPNERQSPDQFQQQCADTLLQRPSGIDDICAAVTYFLSAKSVTGQMIAPDSGQHLPWQSRTRSAKE